MSDAPSTPDVLKTIQDVEITDYLNLSGWRGWALGGVVAALVLLWIYRRVMSVVRSRRPARYNAKLQPYAEGSAALDENLAAKRHVEAMKIVATSSKDTIAGYEIIEQVEAVFVDGFRRPEEALEGLKAAAAMKGANALTNVRHERSTAGKFAAVGDAVTVKKTATVVPTNRETNSLPHVADEKPKSIGN